MKPELASMYICVCNAVSERTIRKAVDDGVKTMEQLRMRTGCATCCGCCEPLAEQILVECLEEKGAGSSRRDSNVLPLYPHASLR